MVPSHREGAVRPTLGAVLPLLLAALVGAAIWLLSWWL